MNTKIGNLTKLLLIIITVSSFFILGGCVTSRPPTSSNTVAGIESAPNNTLTTSLFNDKQSTISEDNIRKILDGHYELPQDLRMSIVNLTNSGNSRSYLWNDEHYLKSQQHYLEMFTDQFKSSSRVKRISAIPSILLAKPATFTSIREAAVRSQSDVVVIYNIENGIYSKYKLFSKTAIKAFATVQLIVLDVRTGLIPFTTIVTKDVQGEKIASDFNELETSERLKDQAVLLSIQDISRQIQGFLNMKTY